MFEERSFVTQTCAFWFDVWVEEKTLGSECRSHTLTVECCAMWADLLQKYGIRGTCNLKAAMKTLSFLRRMKFNCCTGDCGFMFQQLQQKILGAGFEYWFGALSLFPTGQQKEMRHEICLIEKDFDKRVFINLWFNFCWALSVLPWFFSCFKCKQILKQSTWLYIESILTNLRLMGTFPDTEIDWNDIIFNYPSELILPEN